MKKLHKLRNQKGFTIVELLIVIVVIGILAALVLNAFSGVQAKARDTKRQTDIRAISSQLEAWYNGGGNGSYPLNNALTDSYAQTNFPGFDINAFRPPNVASNAMTTGTAVTGGTYSGTSITTWPTGTTPAPTTTTYVYAPFNVAAGAATACSSGTCTHFILSYYNESTSTVVVKQSLN